MPHSAPLRFALLALVLTSALRAQDASPYRTPSPALAALVDAPPTPAVILSPDRQLLLLLERSDAPSIAELAEPELRLAGLRINPATNGPSRGLTYTALALKPVAGGAERRIAGLPAGARIADYEWSRDSRHLAFTLVRADGIELWLADAATAQARRLTGPILNAVFGEPMVWLDEKTLVIRRVPAARGAPPAPSRVPSGPVVQQNLGRKAAAPTYEDLLANARDEALFEHHGIAELALASLDGALTPLPVSGLITSASPSPDGKHLLVETLHRPYSYLVPAARFPKTIDVVDRAGRRENRVADLPLAEGVAAGGVRPGPAASHGAPTNRRR